MKRILSLILLAVIALSACNLHKPLEEQEGAPPVTIAMIAVYNLTTYDITIYLDDVDKGIVPAARFIDEILREAGSRDYKDVPLGTHAIRGESGVISWDSVTFELLPGGYPFYFE